MRDGASSRLVGAPVDSGRLCSRASGGRDDARLPLTRPGLRATLAAPILPNATRRRESTIGGRQLRGFWPSSYSSAVTGRSQGAARQRRRDRAGRRPYRGGAGDRGDRRLSPPRSGVSRCIAPPRCRYAYRFPMSSRHPQPARCGVLPAARIPESLQPVGRHRRVVGARRRVDPAVLGNRTHLSRLRPPHTEAPRNVCAWVWRDSAVK